MDFTNNFLQNHAHETECMNVENHDDLPSLGSRQHI